MSEATRRPRRYSEQEVGLILKRATEIQVAEPTAAGGGGMTLAELEEIAVEAEIDPGHLRRAALELDAAAPDESFWTKVVGSPLDVALEATVPGELSPAGFEDLIPIIQQRLREHGQAGLVGRTLTWQGEASTKTRSSMVVVSVRDGQTAIRVEERLHGLAGQLFGGLVGGVGVGAGVGVGTGVGSALGSALFMAAVPVGTLGLAYLGARHGFRVRARARERVLSDLLERLVAEVSSSLARSTLEGPDHLQRLPKG